MKAAPIHLYTPYFRAETFDRQRELDLCLRRNNDLPEIERIFLLVDDNTTPPFASPKVTVVSLEGRPRYADWLAATRERSVGAISVLANSDVFFDASITRLSEALSSPEKRFVALSRLEWSETGVSRHPNPHWSQDTWAIRGDLEVTPALAASAAVALGVPRCDNKIAYEFFVHGFKVCNPYEEVSSYHVHNTQIRSYDQALDKRIVGGVAYVHPSEIGIFESRLDIDIWTLADRPAGVIKLNPTLPKREASGFVVARRVPPPVIRAYDHEWQRPAITEQHAFVRLSERLQHLGETSDVAYLAFPWATLFDLSLYNDKDAGRITFLRGKLAAIARRLDGVRRVVTTCQHVGLPRMACVLAECGVTDVFWPHAVRGNGTLPGHPEIRVHPFPLYPVKAVGHAAIGTPRERPVLFSFVGAQATTGYLTQARSHILELLSGEPDGRIEGRAEWHYQKAVYDHQIFRHKSAPSLTAAFEEAAADPYRELILHSVFSLCPSGSGPNTIRLWESIGLGAVPVVLADTLELPGERALWERAVVFCGETADEIAALPERLRALAADEARLTAMRAALGILWQRYGDAAFVHDLEQLVRECCRPAALRPVSASPHQDEGIPAAAPARRGWTSLQAVTTALLLDLEVARKAVDAGLDIASLAAAATPAERERFTRVLRLRGLGGLTALGVAEPPSHTPCSYAVDACGTLQLRLDEKQAQARTSSR